MNNDFETTAANVNAGNVLVTADGARKVLAATFERAKVPAKSMMHFKLEGLTETYSRPAYSLVSVKRGA